MSRPLTIAVIVGSARKGSLNRAYARALALIAEGEMVFDLLPVEELPLYNGDLEEALPPVLSDIKQRIEVADGVLFVSPEHNRSVTALMKNTLDWVSRPNGANTWAGKRAAICGVSPGARGADLSQMHLRQIAVCLGLEVLPQPEVYVHHRADLLDVDGTFANERDRNFQMRFIQRFAQWVRAAQL